MDEREDRQRERHPTGLSELGDVQIPAVIRDAGGAARFAFEEFFQGQVRTVLRSQTKDEQADSLAQRAEVQQQMTLAVQQQNRIIDMRINQEIDAEIFAGKQTELRDRIVSLKLQLDVIDRSHDEMCDLAVKVFELSQALASK